MSTPNISGTIRFKVDGQKPYPKWVQQTLKDSIESQEAPPESLRFQCRIATDAKENLKLIELENGETLRLHPKSNPQFGKNRKGHPYLTATMTYSGDGENYTIRWEGDAVPLKMQEVAVKHDKGVGVKPTTIPLDLGKATVAPAWSASRASKQVKNPDVQRAARERYIRKVAEGGRIRAKRTCARMGDRDLQVVA